MEQSERKKVNDESAFQALQWFTLIGAAGIAIFSAQSHGWTAFLGTFSVGIVAAGAAIVFGTLLGFLFGIPRTLRQDKEASSVDGTKAAEPERYGPNTNLEQISDWLTKILVGVGLTQIGRISPKLQGLAYYIGNGLGNTDAARSFALTLVLYFLCCGFLLGYLWTRLYFVRALTEADTYRALTERVDELDRQYKRDATALALVQRQLNPGPDVLKVSPAELEKAVSVASPSVDAQIFYQAQKLRADNWRDNKPVMERTIPVFRALATNDPERRFHQNHGQLGFALKDQRTPANDEAIEEFTKAIEIRGVPKYPGWYIYELCRAMCRIAKEAENVSAKRPSAPDIRASIAKDLKLSSGVESLERIIDDEPSISDWLSLNQLRLDRL